jgi:hypothetical protein
VIESGRDPLTVLVDWIHDPKLSLEFRKECIALALPYCHPRLSASISQVQGGDQPITFVISKDDSNL